MMSMRKVVLEARRKGQTLEEMKEIIAAAQDDVVTAPVTQVRATGLGGGGLIVSCMQRNLMVLLGVLSPLVQGDFLEAIRKVSASVGTHDLNRFRDWMKEFGAT